jgi:16S rRNA (adenine1518-N6/adenine1519-N6)-dimethyltransferase
LLVVSGEWEHTIVLYIIYGIITIKLLEAHCTDDVSGGVYMVQATSPAAVRSLLGRYDLKPRKRLGQHFLWQQQVVKRMADAAELDTGDLVLEIGPGLGILTEACAERAGLVIAVEVDENLFPLLEAELGAYPNVRLVQGDARKVDFESLARTLEPDFSGRCKVMGNLPYYLTSPLLVRLLSGGLQAELLVLMVQREVAGRIVAVPGGKEYGSLSVLVQYYSMPELLFTVPPHDFWPQPEVTSAVVRLRLRPQPAVTTPDPALFFQVVRAAFRYRRKTLRNALGEAGLLPVGGAGRGARSSGGDGSASVIGCLPCVPGAAGTVFEEAGIDPGRRGETLDLAEFACLAEALGRARERVVADALH